MPSALWPHTCCVLRHMLKCVHCKTGNVGFISVQSDFSFQYDLGHATCVFDSCRVSCECNYFFWWVTQQTIIWIFPSIKTINTLKEILPHFTMVEGAEPSFFRLLYLYIHPLCLSLWFSIPPMLLYSCKLLYVCVLFSQSSFLVSLYYFMISKGCPWCGQARTAIPY
jgi:hypothetical protein